MCNSFRNFLPDLSQGLDEIMKLLRKDAVFLWQEKHQKEFEGFKEALNGPLGLRPFERGLITRLYVDYSKHGLGLVRTQQHPND